MGNKRSLGKEETTQRGFPFIKFKDHYDNLCSLQASSLADYTQPGTSAVWLGCEDADAQILASKAAKLGIETTENTGWIPYHIPEDVSLTTRMHLDREQVKLLIEHLHSWLETGHFTITKLK